MKQLQIVYVPIEDLNAAEYNPRRLTETQTEQLRASIRKFGFIDPCIVNDHPDRKNVVVGGHQRLNVARLEGLMLAPVVYVTLPEEQERELNLRLNKNTGEWDWDKLAEFDPNMLLDVGFSKDDLSSHFHLDDDEPSTDPQIDGMQYKVVVTCRDESHQREVLAKLEKEGLSCAALIV